VGTIVNELPFAGLLHQLRGDVTATREVAHSIIALSTEHGFPQWLAVGRILEGWAEAQEGPGPVSAQRVRRAIDEYRATGNDLYVAYFLCVLAALQLQCGAAAEGLETVNAVSAITGERRAGLMEAELTRVHGELLLAAAPGAAAEAERAFRNAIDIARGQKARSWELRATVSLSRLLGRHGQRDEGRRLLAETYAWFTEGFDTADLREARALLDELSAPSR
jgi:adenylate cyclase